jgi:hypothetical protein
MGNPNFILRRVNPSLLVAAVVIGVGLVAVLTGWAQIDNPFGVPSEQTKQPDWRAQFAKVLPEIWSSAESMEEVRGAVKEWQNQHAIDEYVDSHAQSVDAFLSKPPTEFLQARADSETPTEFHDLRRAMYDVVRESSGPTERRERMH